MRLEVSSGAYRVSGLGAGRIKETTIPTSKIPSAKKIGAVTKNPHKPQRLPISGQASPIPKTKPK